MEMKLACQDKLVPGRDLGEKLDNLADYGFEGIELHQQDTVNRQDDILKATRGHQVKPSTIYGGYGGSLLEADPEQRNSAMSNIKTNLETAGNIGAAGFILVPVFGAARLPDLSPYKTAVDLEKELLRVLLEELASVAEKAGTCLLIEPLNRYETHFLKTLDDAVDMCRRIDSPNVKILADFFHMSIEERNIAESIKKAGPYIGHVHLADSTRLLPGHGHTDFKSGFDALRSASFEHFMALECGIPGSAEEELPKSVVYMRQWLK